MLLNVVFASPAPPPPHLPSFSTSHTIFAVASLVFAVEVFKIQIWKAEDNTNQRKKIKIKIGPLQPSKLRNIFDQIQVVK